jgi:TRAP-type C4-dicarboxylate transport system, small permease component
LKIKKFGRCVSLLILPLIAEILYSSIKAFILNDTPIWSFEITLFLYGTFFMLGAAYCHMEKKHVAVEVLAPYLSEKWQRRLAIFSEVVVIFVVLTIIWVSVPAAYRSTLMKERSTHQTPFDPQIWWYRWIIPVSCALICWQSLRDIVGLVTGKGTDKQREEAAEHVA